MLDHHAPLHQQHPQGRVAAASHRRDGWVMHAEVTRLIKIVDGEVGGFACFKRADTFETEHPCAACGTDPHDVFHRHRTGVATGLRVVRLGLSLTRAWISAVQQPRRVRLADHVGGFV